MNPIKTEDTNKIFAEDQPEYTPLPVRYFPDGQLVSVWELTDEEVEEITKTKRLHIAQLSFHAPLQPINPSVTGKEIYTEQYLANMRSLRREYSMHLLAAENKEMKPNDDFSEHLRKKNESVLHLRAIIDSLDESISFLQSKISLYLNPALNGAHVK